MPSAMCNLRWCCLLALLIAANGRADGQRKATVGMTGKIEQIVLDGSELEVVPLDRKSPVVLRIIEAYPHGSAYRYDLAYYGLEPGEFDLKPYLRRKDRTTTADLPSIRVTVEPVLPPGHLLPHELEPKGSPFLGGYRLALLAFGSFWLLGMVAFVFYGWRKRKAIDGPERAVTLADRLRPLVEDAMAGTLTPVQRAELERMLLAYWQRRLNLGAMKPHEVFVALRRHPEAGPLLEQLELWLHRPGPAPIVDLARLLRPYRDVPADTVSG
jgi:hypothetical protein